jgi:hypothetical protein
MAAEELHLLQDIDGRKVFHNSELVMGLVGAVGTELDKVVTILSNSLKGSNYEPCEVVISEAVIPQVIPKMEKPEGESEYQRITRGMNNGDDGSVKCFV